MPRFDGTGPNGRGPMTGRGMGRCNNKVVVKDSGFNNEKSKLDIVEEISKLEKRIEELKKLL